jgi:DNA-binding response OmpR family regulator
MRVLLVEHDRQLARQIKRCLDEQELSVEVCHDPDDATGRAKDVAYDLIVLSLCLPRAEGPAVLRRWRKEGVTRPILALTDATTVADKVRCLDLGADDYLARPFLAVELVARVRALLRQASRAYDPVLRIHDLEIDTHARLVKRAGKVIRLTRREYDLLHFLALNCGRVVSRSMIYEHLYHGDEIGRSNVVDVFIRFLRGKIDRGFDPPLILTRWGEGYLLRGEEDALASETEMRNDEG